MSNVAPTNAVDFLRFSNVDTTGKASVNGSVGLAQMTPFFHLGVDGQVGTPYSPADSSTLKHLKIVVASPSDDPVLDMDTLELHYGVSQSEKTISEETNFFDTEKGQRYGPSKGTPVRFQRVHFLAKRHGLDQTPKEHFAYFLVSDPVLVSDPTTATDATEQSAGSVGSWNDLSYITDSSEPTNTQYAERLTIALTGEAGSVPVGVIVAWPYAGALPDGWAECDGGTYNSIVTPNLKGRFLVGSGSHDADLAKYPEVTIGTESGFMWHGWIENNHKDHYLSHTTNPCIPIATCLVQGGNSKFDYLDTQVEPSCDTVWEVQGWCGPAPTNDSFAVGADQLAKHVGYYGPTGEGDTDYKRSVDNRPPFYAIRWIMYVGT